jgi:hypothetical protein
VSTNNASNGISCHSVSGGAPAFLMVRNSTIANNGFAGLQSQASSIVGALIRVTRSTITGNSVGWATPSNGVVVSYGDNNIDGNTSVNTEPPNPLVYH